MPNVFDCHLCDTKKTTFEVLAESKQASLEDYKDKNHYTEVTQLHQVCKCNSCSQYFYQKIQLPKKQRVLLAGQYPKILEQGTRSVMFVYPFTKVSLPNYIDKYIKQYYKEAVNCLSIEAYDASSVMFRKCVYRICNVEKIPTKRKGKTLDSKERIKLLKLPKEINDVLCNVKYIGDDSAHIDQEPYSPTLLRKLQDALRISFRLLYEEKEVLKDFNNKYSQENQKNNSK
ncbi:hypothetical protein COU49_02480 [Candidatus Nomurabacteria bacterium CG10_big_fil_rev_8_21_14_0_10_35_16]|uniref:DUF4145 domain-containing protein n=1 Tax=Candidatus Nomurabacteria bacterium CG10_big_fil_rev_8_21_14_0_10_35_16 TaxID=1974731 RepID=A0A2H0TAZ2_9BACT|nr:MAG: hypothetical protein COU49_02480 [Candidatus Nomurabacteria bacterium CG10_big_fil_rev_8_21_14_0_10_35_16]